MRVLVKCKNEKAERNLVSYSCFVGVPRTFGEYLLLLYHFSLQFVRTTFALLCFHSDSVLLPLTEQLVLSVHTISFPDKIEYLSLGVHNYSQEPI